MLTDQVQICIELIIGLANYFSVARKLQIKVGTQDAATKISSVRKKKTDEHGIR